MHFKSGLILIKWDVSFILKDFNVTKLSWKKLYRDHDRVPKKWKLKTYLFAGFWVSQDKSVYICKTDYKKNCKSYVQNCIIWLPFAPNWYSTENCTIENFIHFCRNLVIREYILNRFSSEKYNLNIALKSKNVLTYISNFYDVIMNKQIFLILFFASEFYHFDGVKYEKWNVSPKFRRAKIKSKKEIIKMQKTFLKFKSY